MVRNLFGWLYRKQDTDQLRNDFEGDTMTMTVVTPMTMDEATHVLTEDLIPSGFSTLNYPKGTQIKEIPKESSLRNFLFPDGKTGWVDVARVQCIVPVEEHISTPDYIIDNSDTTVTPESKSSTRELLGYCRYDVLSEDISVYRGDWIHAKVTSHDTNHWNLVSDIPVKPVRECSTLMELFGMKTGDLLYPMENQEYHHVLKDIVFSDGIFLFHVLDIFVGNSRYHISNYSIPVSTEVFDRAVELTKESEEN